MTDRPNQTSPNPHRPSLGGWSALLLMALTVQLSVSMLEWAGPASVETRTRLATTIVAAAHLGVFTEPDRPVGGMAVRPARSRVRIEVRRPTPVSQSVGSLAVAVSPWSTGLAPPAA